VACKQEIILGRLPPRPNEPLQHLEAVLQHTCPPSAAAKHTAPPSAQGSAIRQAVNPRPTPAETLPRLLKELPPGRRGNPFRKVGSLHAGQTRSNAVTTNWVAKKMAMARIISIGDKFPSSSLSSLSLLACPLLRARDHRKAWTEQGDQELNTKRPTKETAMHYRSWRRVTAQDIRLFFIRQRQ